MSGLIASAGLLGCGAIAGSSGDWLRPGDGEIVKELFAQSGLRLGASVLDVGCGVGESLGWLERHGYTGIGIDRDGDVLAFAATRVASALFQGDATCLPFADSSFDAVLSECSLSLMPDRRAALGEWRRVLKDDGRLLLADVDWPGDDDRDGLAEDVAAAGFSILDQQDRSEVLAGFAARFIFQHGSLDALWGDCRRKGDARPRYRLVIAAASPRTGSVEP